MQKVSSQTQSFQIVVQALDTCRLLGHTDDEFFVAMIKKAHDIYWNEYFNVNDFNKDSFTDFLRERMSNRLADLIRDAYKPMESNPAESLLDSAP